MKRANAARTRQRRDDPEGPPAAKLVLRSEDWARVVRLLRLSQQQARIVQLVLHGRADKQIASALRLRVPTVRTYLSRLYERTHCGNRVGLILMVFGCVYDALCELNRHRKQ